jgi:hypothetical protein
MASLLNGQASTDLPGSLPPAPPARSCDPVGVRSGNVTIKVDAAGVITQLMYTFGAGFGAESASNTFHVYVGAAPLPSTGTAPWQFPVSAWSGTSRTGGGVALWGERGWGAFGWKEAGRLYQNALWWTGAGRQFEAM